MAERATTDKQQRILDVIRQFTAGQWQATALPLVSGAQHLARLQQAG